MRHIPLWLDFVAVGFVVLVYIFVRHAPLVGEDDKNVVDCSMPMKQELKLLAACAVLAFLLTLAVG